MICFTVSTFVTRMVNQAGAMGLTMVLVSLYIVCVCAPKILNLEMIYLKLAAMDFL